MEAGWKKKNRGAETTKCAEARIMFDDEGKPMIAFSPKNHHAELQDASSCPASMSRSRKGVINDDDCYSLFSIQSSYSSKSKDSSVSVRYEGSDLVKSVRSIWSKESRLSVIPEGSKSSQSSCTSSNNSSLGEMSVISDESTSTLEFSSRVNCGDVAAYIVLLPLTPIWCSNYLHLIIVFHLSTQEGRKLAVAKHMYFEAK